LSDDDTSLAIRIAKPSARSAYRRNHQRPFRHTFGTILNANGENPKVIQELWGHATLKVTMHTYVQAVSDKKRNAQTKVVRMLLSGHSQGS
jgi:integrase